MMKRLCKKLAAAFLAAGMLTCAATTVSGSFALLKPDIIAGAAETATSGTCGENLTWSFDEKTATLTIEGSGEMDDYPGSPPWSGLRKQIQAIEFPDGLTGVGAWAFAECRELTSITLPETVKYIGYSSFEFCEKLRTVTVLGMETDLSYGPYGDSDYELSWIAAYWTIIAKPNSCAAEYAVSHRIKLEYLGVQTDSSGLEISDQIVCDGKKCSGEVVIPEGVTAVVAWAFAHNDKLTGITFPATCKEVGALALYDCPNLEKVTFLNPDTVIRPKDELRIDELGLDRDEGNIAPKIRLPKWNDSLRWAICNNHFEVTTQLDDRQSGWEYTYRSYYTLINWPEFHGTIYGETGSTAEEFANGYCDFKSLDGLTEKPCDHELIFSGGGWKFETATGTLYIEGKGRLDQYGVFNYADGSYDTKYAPWYEFSPKIKCAVISELLTDFSPVCFSGCSRDIIIIIGEALNKAYINDIWRDYCSIVSL